MLAVVCRSSMILGFMFGLLSSYASHNRIGFKDGYEARDKTGFILFLFSIPSYFDSPWTWFSFHPCPHQGGKKKINCPTLYNNITLNRLELIVGAAEFPAPWSPLDSTCSWRTCTHFPILHCPHPINSQLEAWILCVANFSVSLLHNSLQNKRHPIAINSVPLIYSVDPVRWSVNFSSASFSPASPFIHGSQTYAI